MTKYETTFILEPGLDEARVNEEIERVSKAIADLGGQVIEVQRWGKRRLAYEIRRRRDGMYVHVLHEGPGAIVKELERRLRLVETVLRVLTVVHVPPEPVRVPLEGETVPAIASDEGED